MPSTIVATLYQNLVSSLTDAVTKVLGIDKHRVDAQLHLSDYGFDSITLTQLESHLNSTFNFIDLGSSVFLEYTTINSLSDYLIKHYHKEFSDFFNISASLNNISNTSVNNDVKEYDRNESEFFQSSTLGLVNESEISTSYGSVDELYETLVLSLTDAVSKVLGIDKKRIDYKLHLSDYGFDSITLTQLANQLNSSFDFIDLSSSVFLEYTTINGLADYLFKYYRKELSVFFNVSSSSNDVNNLSSVKENNKIDDCFQGSNYTEKTVVDPVEEYSSLQSSFVKSNNKSVRGSDLLASFEDEFTLDEMLLSSDDVGENENSIRNNGDENLNQKSSKYSSYKNKDIAVIGIGGRFPGANNVFKFWENIISGVNSITEVPENRWDWREIYGNPDTEDNITDCIYGGFLDSLDNFDPLFFGISPREALQMDPQHKITMMAAWETVESAGYTRDELRNRDIGVYLGVQRNENLVHLMGANRDFGPYTNIGNTHSMLANRISYFFDWKGNSLALDTACSASAVALHSAFHALQRGEIEMSLVGGVTVVQDPFSHIANRKMGLLTGQREVRSFDINADGYLIGEGVATVLLKPLMDAERDNDYIYGIIKSCSVNQSGKTVFLTAPDPKAHTNVIRQALFEANLSPSSLDYIEGQGTGTELSDQAELKAYSEVFSADGKPSQVGLGSIKANIGHLEAASGVASLIKVCLAMKNEMIPPTLHFEQLNWRGPFNKKDLPFEVITQPSVWKNKVDVTGESIPRRAGVHNFGYGGSNTHTIVEEKINNRSKKLNCLNKNEAFLLFFSARTNEQLTSYLNTFLKYVQYKQYHYVGLSSLSLADTAFTLRYGREEMKYRVAIVSTSIDDMVESIQQYLNGSFSTEKIYSGSVSSVGSTEKSKKNSHENMIQSSTLMARDLASSWVNGDSVKEQAVGNIFGNINGLRIPLPGYCFSISKEETNKTYLNSGPQLNPMDWSVYFKGFVEVDAIIRQLLMSEFEAWGVFDGLGKVWQVDAFIENSGIAPNHKRLIPVLLDMLVRENVLEKNGDNYRVLTDCNVDMVSLQNRKDTFIRSYQKLSTQINTSWECVKNIKSILTDEIPATRILFPDNSMDKVEGFYKGNPVMDYLNQLVTWQLVEYIEQRIEKLSDGEKINILEIGAGTGGTTACVLPALQPYADRLRYVYSDISAGFTVFGKQKYGEASPFLEFEVLNIEKELSNQGFEENSFDVIIAANVLHATSDMKCTMSNARQLLKSDGKLILNEVIHAQDFVSLTFGLLQGWWMFEDENMRLPGGPLLNSKMWTELLTEQGFPSVKILGDKGSDGKSTGYNIVVSSNETKEYTTSSFQDFNKNNAICNAEYTNDVAQKIITDIEESISVNTMMHTKKHSNFSSQEITKKITDTIAQALFLESEDLDINVPLSSFGLDSFTSIQIIKTLNESLSINLRNTDLFNFPTVKLLDDHIFNNLYVQSESIKSTVSPLKINKKTVSKSESINKSKNSIKGNGQQDIAIIGISGRFPQADNIEEYWSNLLSGQDCISTVPKERWQPSQFFGGFVDNIDRFDPLFFRISPKEAQWMDPQQRLFLLEAWRAIENSGYSAESLDNSRCGVYVGCREGDYLLPFTHLEKNGYQGTGNSSAILSARIAYNLNLKGPSISIDTACSSSLVAVILACDSLRSGACELALAGGVSLMTTEDTHQVLHKTGMLSPDGKCKTFDDKADGFVPGEAVAAILLKPLATATEDNDHIYGVIKATGMNQDGRTSGITASSSLSQAELIKDTYERYNIDCNSIGYIETHGTGTSLGDPIEIDALSEVFSRSKDSLFNEQKQYCAIGSVKTNIGHTLAAAGIVSLIKSVLMLSRKTLVPSLHFEKENDNLNLKNTPFYVNTKVDNWNTGNDKLRRVAINSFGFSGTNAHCVIEESSQQSQAEIVTQDQGLESYLIPLSAKTSEDLQVKIRDLHHWIQKHGEGYSLRDISATLLLGRTHYDYRFVTIAKNASELEKNLKEFYDKSPAYWQEDGEVLFNINPSKTFAEKPALTILGTQLLQKISEENLTLDDYHTSLLGLSDLYREGYSFSWELLYQGLSFSKVPLPTYPFVGDSYWLTSNDDCFVNKKVGLSSLSVKKHFEPIDNSVSISADKEFINLAFDDTDLSLSERKDLECFQDAYSHLPEFSAQLLLKNMQEMGVFIAAGEKYTIKELQDKISILPKYNRLLIAFMKVLVEANWIKEKDNSYISTDLIKDQNLKNDLKNISRKRDQLLEEFPQVSAFLNLLWVCASNSIDVLRGDVSATEIMYPNSSFELVKGIYRENATADYYNKVLSDQVAEKIEIMLQDLPKGKKIKILEIGAGTGGTSGLLLEKIKGNGDRLQYYYTDISSGFVQYGRRTYGSKFSFTEFEVLDIEKGVGVGNDFGNDFDIIVAANVIHATSDLTQALTNVKSLIKPSGYLVLNEATDVQTFALMTYGLLDGWWLFNDEHKGIRLENSPLLDTKKWIDFLEGLGFEVAHPLGCNNDNSKGPGQHIIAAKYIDTSVIDNSRRYKKRNQQENTSQINGDRSDSKVDKSALLPESSKATSSDLINFTQTNVTQSICHILNLDIDKLDAECEFSNYGLDSISGIDFVSDINKRFSIDLRITALFNYPCVKDLSKYIYNTYAEQLDSILGEGELNNQSETEQNTSKVNFEEITPPKNESSNKEKYNKIKDFSDNTIDSINSEDITIKKKFNSDEKDDIVIIGMSGRFPRSKNTREFWEMLEKGASGIGSTPSSRKNGKASMQVFNSGFLDDIDQFDARFFNWSGVEAEQSDPQQRIFLEECYSAIEDAGYSPDKLNTYQCGVFAGAGMSDYLMNMHDNGYTGEAQTFWGNSPAVIPARISYFLNLKGPTISVDTACSSSLVAMHYACKSLQTEECDIALAGGIYLQTTGHYYQLANKAEMLSPDAQCKAFDDSANGFVFSEGAGVMVLKKHSLAIRDRDNIRAIIKASGVNQDGKTNGITSPSSNSQTELEVSVYKSAKINPETISFVEAHGTGTRLGDPIEIEALTNAFRKFTNKKQFCRLGSVKTNIGHASLAAGMAGLIKVVKSFEHQQIPPSLHFDRPNSFIDFDNTPFYINKDLQRWDSEEGARRAAVSGFGLSGTNAHLVLEEAPVKISSSKVESNEPLLICLSAKTKYSLNNKVIDLVNYLEKDGKNEEIKNIAYTLHVGRSHFGFRVSFIAKNHQDCIEKLRDIDIEKLDLIQIKDSDKEVDELTSKLAKKSLSEGEMLKFLNQLSELYDSGKEINWDDLYVHSECYRTSLPTYPFDRSSYWFQKKEEQNNNLKINGATPSFKDTDFQQTLWHPYWVNTDLDNFGYKDNKQNNTILVFGHIDNYINNWEGSRVISIREGNDFSYNLGDRPVFEMRFSEEDDYRKLVEVLIQNDCLPDEIVYFHPQTDFVLNNLEDYLNRGIYSIFLLSKELLKKSFGKDKIRIIYAFITGDSRVQALNQAVSGFAKTLNQETSRLFCQTLEVDDEINLLQAVENEFNIDENQEVEVRYQVGAKEKLIRQLKLWKLSDDEKSISTPLRLKENGIYLLVGGTGGVGFLFLQYLKEQSENQNVPIEIIVTFRRELDFSFEKNIHNMNSNLCYIRCIQSDITVYESVNKLISQIKCDSKSNVEGVFHFAGRMNDGLILNKNKCEFEDVISPKVHGTLFLEKALEDHEIGFLSLFSSATAVMGNPGQADYAYANSFLDAFSAQGGIRGSYTFSSNWALWLDGGMKPPQDNIDSIAKYMGIEPLSTTMGIEAWETIFNSENKQTMFLSGNQEKITSFVNKTYDEPKKKASLLDVEVMNNKIDELLLNSVAMVTKLPLNNISLYESIESYGLDSLMITKLNKILFDEFEDLSATLFYEFPNLESLSKHLKSCKPKHSFAVKNNKVSGQNVYQKTKKESKKIETPNSEDLSTIGEKRGENNTSVDGNLVNFDVAVIGMSGVYPQANNLDEFWENLKQGKDAITEVPKNRWNADDYFDEDKKKSLEGKCYCKWGGFVDNVEGFDAFFFNINPREAKVMDPTERLFLETAWATFEDAGYTRERFNETSGMNVGVFAGITNNSYSLWGPQEWAQGNMSTPCSGFWSIANRVSYFMNFNGPSYPVDTACSASITAIHIACQSLRVGECKMALAGGATFYLHPFQYTAMSQAQMLSPTGKCHSFGEEADGFVPGEGVGAVLLKPLKQAINDNDQIHAVIKTSTVNHGGRTNGYSVPSPKAHAELISESFKRANIDPHTIGYVEAHGTGTALGDPIEIEGLCRVWDDSSKETSRKEEKQVCPVGALKSNIGHLLAAAGIAGVTKVILQMKNKTLVPSLNAKNLNSNINFENTPFFIQKDLEDWNLQKSGVPRRASVSSFGAGGANAHLILEEYDDIASTGNRGQYDNGKYLILISARSFERLNIYAKNILEFWKKKKDKLSLADFSFTLQRGREAMEERLAFEVSSKEDVITLLEKFLNGSSTENDEIFNGRVSNNNVFENTIDTLNTKKIAMQWVKGAVINWNEVFGKDCARYISLPTYPFVKNRHWYPLSKEDTELKRIYNLNNVKALLPSLDHSADQNVISAISDGKINPINVSVDSHGNKSIKQIDVVSEELVEDKKVIGVKSKITKIVSDIIQADIKEVNVDATYLDIGIDSILSIELIESVNKTLNIKIRTTDLFNYPTISQLASYVVSKYEYLMLDKEFPANAPQQQQNDKSLPELSVLQIFERLQNGELDIDNTISALETI